MAHPNPIIRIRENNRGVPRGCYWDGDIGRHVLQATDRETTKLIVDYTDVLNGATITVDVSQADGVGVSSSVSTGVVTLTLTNVACSGDIDMKVTFSDGRVWEVFIRIKDPFSSSRDDYGYPIRALP